MSSQKCVCGKHGDKQCSRCKLTCYCSRECQVADFPKHKKICKVLTNVITPSTANDTWRNIMTLPLTCAINLLPKAGPPSIPLEQLLPMFVTLFHTNCQCQMMNAFSPAIALHKGDNKYTVVTLNSKSMNVPTIQNFTSFKTFIGACQTPPDATVAKEAYLMMSHFAKCTQVVIAFGLLVVKTFQTQQLTYGGERVIGWAIQDGTIKPSHPNIAALQVINVNSSKDLTGVMASVRGGGPLPAGVTSTPIGRNQIHVWLTFVTETGRIYDLDLSAFQFGTMDPFPCIVPVLSAEPTAFNGMVDRHRILCNTLPTLHQTVHSLISAHVDGVNSVRGAGGPVTSDMMQQAFLAIIDIITGRGQQELPKFGNPAYCWDLLCNLK